MDFYQFLVPRLDGDRIDELFPAYRELVHRGVAGFIVFGGEIRSLRNGIMRLQRESALPLLIASDLEQGLGQQVRGGTLFPPASALAAALPVNPHLLRSAFSQMAEEAAYAGINTIIAPVLDVDTNPLNPIIATRAFGREPDTVSACAGEMIRVLESRGLRSCGKHFPGHGNTVVDSHISLPLVEKSLEELESCELRPFATAIRDGVSMMMIGHLRVPAIDPTGEAMTFSHSCMRRLRQSMNFQGIITTDAMNMGALEGYSPGEAARLALEAGVDVILHPEDPDTLARELSNTGLSPSSERLMKFRTGLMSRPAVERPSFDTTLRDKLSSLAIRTEGPSVKVQNPYTIVLSDDEEETGSTFRSSLGGKYFLPERGEDITPGTIPTGHDVVVAVFSSVRAWKGGTSPWLRACLRAAEQRADVFVSFGNPHTLDTVRADATKIYAYWSAPCAQELVAGSLRSP